MNNTIFQGNYTSRFMSSENIWLTEAPNSLYGSTPQNTDPMDPLWMGITQKVIDEKILHFQYLSFFKLNTIISYFFSYQLFDDSNPRVAIFH